MVTLEAFAKNIVALFFYVCCGVTLSFTCLAKAQNPKATVITDGAMVYLKPDFDSEVMGYAEAGKVYDISNKKFNQAFHRIRLSKGKIGYIADNDLDLSNVKGAKAKSKSSDKKSDRKSEVAKKERPLRPYTESQYAGFQYAQINYSEKTMGRLNRSALDFIGIKLSGPDLVFSGPANTEVNMLLAGSAPGYYEKATGRGAGGMVLLTNILFQNANSLGKEAGYFYGFGPMLKYSRFDVQLGSGSSVKQYNLEDVSLGMVFNLGAGFRFSKISVRADYTYFWESESYSGLGVSIQYGF